MSSDAVDYPGGHLLLEQVQRQADRTLGAIDSTRGRSRANLSAAAVGLTVALAVSARQDVSWWEVAIAVLAVALFLLVVGIAVWIDFPREMHVTPNIAELRGHVGDIETGYTAAALELWTADAYVTKVIPNNHELMVRLSGALERQMIALVLETVTLALLLLVLMIS